MSGLLKAVKHYYGTQAKMAAALGVSPQAVNQWVKRGWAPIEHARRIEADTGIDFDALIAPRLRGVCECDATPRAA